MVWTSLFLHLLVRGDIEILDFNLDCWKEGINRIEQDIFIFEGYAKELLDWIGEAIKNFHYFT